MAHIKHLKKNKNEVLIDAEFRIKIEKEIQKFSYSSEMQYEFPASLTNVERAFVHNLAPRFNLKTKSSGSGSERKLSLFKPVEQRDIDIQNASIELNSTSRELIDNFFKNHSDYKHDIKEIKAPPVQLQCPTVLRNSPSIPSQSNQNDPNIHHIRQNLPIFPYKDQILQLIDRNRVILIHGSTGSGKTTQIPQYIMDLAAHKKEPCRIICTQPRRISAISSAERVCYERGIEIGTTIGYQIRLDSKIQNNSNCIFLTPGVFLRYLMAIKPEEVFSKITHIVIDEAHEHAKENDFLLTSIREHININPKLKLIIMSATMDTAIFNSYFNGFCEEISIFSKQFEVEEFYLDDVLKIVNYSNKKVEELKKKYESGEVIQASKSAYVNEEEGDEEIGELDEETTCLLDEILDNMSVSDNPEMQFNQFFYFIQNENIPVNFRHTKTQMTALMIAVGRGWKMMIEKLLNLKADPCIKVNFQGEEMSSIDIAEQIFGENSEIKELLIRNGLTSKVTSNEESYNKALINIYQDSFLKSKSNNFVIEEMIDHELIVQLVEKIHFGAEKHGAILIFLPGFDDILQLSRLVKERIKHGYILFMLHSSMKTDDQKNVFKPAYQGKRKIILSTNIAESSITIDDIIYVIDSGREKQKSFDAISHSSSLRVQWISKASANQRRGRAGRLRNGIVYRIYSRDRYKSMLDVTIPELLRSSLSEVCLQTKLLIQNSSTSSIEEFLLKCIACPSAANIRQSIKYLQKLGALDENENLTLLGSHLAHMPLDARYGKMLINSIIFKCFDPILSLVSILSVGEQIFLLPITPADRAKCINWRNKVAGESLSDHYMMLKIFKMWLNLKLTHQNDWKFCEENFISRNHIEHVIGIKKQIIGYLEQSELLLEKDVINDNSKNWSLLKGVICSGLYPFIARIDFQNATICTEIDSKLNFHMSSVLNVKKDKSKLRKLPVEWVVFEEKQRIGKMSFLKCNTLINNLTVSLFAGTSFTEDLYKIKPMPSVNGWTEEEIAELSKDDVPYQSPYSHFKIDGLVKFTATNEDAQNIFVIKNRLNFLITRFLSNRKFKFNNEENELIKIIAEIVDDADERCRMMKMDLVDCSVVSSEFNSQQKLMSSLWRSGDVKTFNDKRGGGENSRNYNKKCSGNERNFNKKESGYFQPSTSSSQQNFFPDNRRVSKKPRQKLEFHQPQYSNQKFYILKVNAKKFIENLARNIVTPLEELNLKNWQFHKIKSQVSRGAHIHVIFYSTHKNEFQGYGDVVYVSDNHSLQFHYREGGKCTLSDLSATDFSEYLYRIVGDTSFIFDVIDSYIGNSLILYFK